MTKLSEPRLSSNERDYPNPRDWDLGVENWFETEGGVARRTGVILIAQKRKEPLQKLRGALKKDAGLAGRPMLRSGVEGHAIQLGAEDSARFVRTFKKRVKIAKALRDLEIAERRLRRKGKRYLGPARRTIQILEGSSI